MPKIEIDIPVDIGTPVYLVHDKCRPEGFQCIFNGGYGTSRCRGNGHGDLCKAYSPVSILAQNNRNCNSFDEY